MDYSTEISEYIAKGETGSSFEQGHRFLEWVLLNLFDRTETDLINDDINDGVIFPDGQGDHGVDCAFVDGDSLYIIQGKERKYHDPNNIKAFKEDISQFLHLTSAKGIRDKLKPVFSSLHDEEIREIKIYYITNNYMENEARNHSYNETCRCFNEEFSRLLNKSVVWEIVGFEKFSTIHTGILLELPKAARKAKSTLLLARFLKTVMKHLSLPKSL